jgi:hypothetical protein
MLREHAEAEDHEHTKHTAADNEDNLKDGSCSTKIKWLSGRQSKSPRQVEADTGTAEPNIINIPTRAKTRIVLFGSKKRSEDKENSSEEEEDASDQQ